MSLYLFIGLAVIVGFTLTFIVDGRDLLRNPRWKKQPTARSFKIDCGLPKGMQALSAPGQARLGCGIAALFLSGVVCGPLLIFVDADSLAAYGFPDTRFLIGVLAATIFAFFYVPCSRYEGRKHELTVLADGREFLFDDEGIFLSIGVLMNNGIQRSMVSKKLPYFFVPWSSIVAWERKIWPDYSEVKGPPLLYYSVESARKLPFARNINVPLVERELELFNVLRKHLPNARFS